MMKLPETLQVPIDAVAAKLHIPAEWLAKLVAFESRFDPRAANPHSSAKGLIQFIDATAQDLGYVDSYDLVESHPTFTSQMYGPVLSYLERYAPYDDEQALYMSVFYPAAKDWPPEKLFPGWVQDENPGITCPGDYVAAVNRHAALIGLGIAAGKAIDGLPCETILLVGGVAAAAAAVFLTTMTRG